MLITVEWSCFDDFIPLAGEEVVEDMRHLEHEIKGLVKGNKYFVRVAACNMKGYSGHTIAKPAYAVPSCEFTPLSKWVFFGFFSFFFFKFEFMNEGHVDELSFQFSMRSSFCGLKS